MKRTIIDQSPPRLRSRLAWFVAIWAASVAILSGVAYALHKIILG